MEFRKSNQKNNSRGFTLTEAAIFFGVAGVILSGVWIAAAAVYSSSRLTTTTKQLMEIVQRTRSLHGTMQGMMLDTSLTGTAGAVTIARTGIVPSDMVDNPADPTTVVNLWGGDVTFTTLTTVVAGDSFTIGLEDVPRQACADLLVRMTGALKDSSMIAAGTTSGPHTSVDFPLGVTAATGSCSNELNTVEFTFMLKT